MSVDWEKAAAELAKKLDPSHVRPPSKFGPKGDYIEGWHAIAEANRIFGFNGWSYTIKSMTQDALDFAKDGKGNPQWQAAYTCIVTLSVDGALREDVGFGSGFAKNKGDAVEGATKEAVTDALKRALRTFGNPFGLALYDKSRENVGRDEPAKAPDKSERERMVAALGKCKGHAEYRKLVDHPSYCDAYNKLSQEDQLAVFEAEERAKSRFDPAMQAPPNERAA